MRTWIYWSSIFPNSWFLIKKNLREGYFIKQPKIWSCKNEKKISNGLKIIACLGTFLIFFGCSHNIQRINFAHLKDSIKVGVVQKNMVGDPMIDRYEMWVKPGFIATMDYGRIKKGETPDCYGKLDNGDFICSWSLSIGTKLIIKPSGELYGTLSGLGIISSHSGSPPNLFRKIDILEKGSFREQLIYNGKGGNIVKIAYREFKEDMARPAFSQDLTYDLSENKIIGFKDILIEIINATNTYIEFVVKSKGKETSLMQKATPPISTSAKPTYSKTAKEPSEYVSWGLGVIVKTDQKTTITNFIKEGNRSAKEFLKVGDEIIKVGKDYLEQENAYKILTRSIQVEADDLVPIIVRRESKDITYRIRPNW